MSTNARISIDSLYSNVKFTIVDSNCSYDLQFTSSFSFPDCTIAADVFRNDVNDSMLNDFEASHLNDLTN